MRHDHAHARCLLGACRIDRRDASLADGRTDDEAIERLADVPVFRRISGATADLEWTVDPIDGPLKVINNLLSVGLIYFGIVVIVGATGGYLLAAQALRPIARLTKTAKQMSTETLDQRINLGGPDYELRELADTFDDMLARLDAAFESQRLFVANASHELRTPLT